MINVTDIQNKAVGLVGWRQSTKSGSPVLSDENKASRSGLYYQDGSALVTIDNILATVDDPELGIEEEIEEEEGGGEEQETIPTKLDTYLSELSKAAFIELLSSVGFSDVDIIENRILYKNPNDWTKTIENACYFVGYEILLPRSKDYSVIINQISTEFDQDTDIELMLFCTTQKNPIETKTITTVADTGTLTDLNWVLSSKWKTNTFYLGYIQSSAKAYNRTYQDASVITPFTGVCIRPFRVPISGETLFDINKAEYTAETYGINLDITTIRDYTDLILRNENNFARGLQLQVAIKVLDLISNSTRTNRDERLSKANALFELNGNRINPEYPEHTGILSKLKKEVSRLRMTYISTPPLSRVTL